MTSPTSANPHHHNFKASETITERIEREEDLRMSQGRRSVVSGKSTSLRDVQNGHANASPAATKFTTSNTSLKTLLFTWPEVPQGPKSAYALQQRIRYHRHERASPEKVNPQYRTMSGSSVSFATSWDDPDFIDPLRWRHEQRPPPPAKPLEPDETDWRDDASLNGEYRPSGVGLDDTERKKEWQGDSRDLYEGFMPTVEPSNKYKAYREKFEQSYSPNSSRRSASVHSSRRSNASLLSSRRSSASPQSARSMPGDVQSPSKGVWGPPSDNLLPRSPVPRPRTSSSTVRSNNLFKRRAPAPLTQDHDAEDATIRVESPIHHQAVTTTSQGMPPLHKSGSPRSRTLPSNPLPRSPIQRKTPKSATSVRSEPLELRPNSSASSRGHQRKYSSTLSVRTEPADFSPLATSTTVLSPQKVSIQTIEFNGEPVKAPQFSSRRSSTSSFSNRKRYNLGLSDNRKSNDDTSITSLKRNYLQLRKQLPLQERYKKPSTSSHEYGWLVKSSTQPFKPPKDFPAGMRLPEKKSHLFMTLE